MLKKQFILPFVLVLFSVFSSLALDSCKKYDRKNEFKVHNEFQEYGASNLLRFMVKEDHFSEEGLKLRFNDISWRLFDEGIYDLKISLDTLEQSIDSKDSYLLVALYPKDDELEILAAERRKYGFESFSITIGKTKDGKLFANRKIKTKLNYARAITIAIMDYKTKEKSMEIVLSDVNLLPKTIDQ